MPFKNKIRIPFYLTRPQFPIESNVFRLANGNRKTLSAIVLNTFEGETDNLPKVIHERLIIALKHDDVTIEGRYLTTGVSLDGDYDIDWNKFLDFPLAKAAFKVQVTPFNYSNDNCQTCDEATQLSLEDDTITGPYEVLEEGQEYEYNVFANDSICCSPVTAEIVTLNSTYVALATISAASGIVTITMQAAMAPATLANLLTYRVTCPNGSYDDADVFANVDGTEPPAECAIPANLWITDITETEATATWDVVPGAISYFWQLYLAASPIIPIDTGFNFTNILALSGLTAGTGYILYVQTYCSESASAFANVSFDTIGETGEDCGQYQLDNNALGFTNVSYLDCNGNYQNVVIQTGQSSVICALQNSPGDPVDIIDQNGNVTISYIGLC
jgi:hypothetical protein